MAPFGVKGQHFEKPLCAELPAESFEPCGHPGTPTYGVPSSDKLHFQAGETLLYSCLPGHELLGEPLLRCVPGHPSQWSGLPPVCKGEELQPVEVNKSDSPCLHRRSEGEPFTVTADQQNSLTKETEEDSFRGKAADGVPVFWALLT